MNLPLALLILGGSSLAVWAGLTDPEGGLGAAIGRVLRGDKAGSTNVNPSGSPAWGIVGLMQDLAGVVGTGTAGGSAAGVNAGLPSSGHVSGHTAWPTTSHAITTGYHVPGNWAAGYHTGIDIAAADGSPAYAPADGTVTAAGFDGEYGNAVQVKSGPYLAMLCHLSHVGVTPGQHVKAGQLVGKTGHSGRVFSSTGGDGAHLHFEVRTSPFTYGHDVDPMVLYSRPAGSPTSHHGGAQ